MSRTWGFTVGRWKYRLRLGKPEPPWDTYCETCGKRSGLLHGHIQFGSKGGEQ